MTTPLVSVVVATYRRDDSLRKALQSLTEQSYKQVEIIVVDENDDLNWNQTVREIVDSFQQNIILIENHPNLGSAQARNAGIQAATGAFITFLDDDDLYLPEKISHQVTAMMQAGADYCITDLNLFNEQEKCIEKRTRAYLDSTESDKLLRYHLMYHMTGTDTLMFRSEYLRKIGGFPPINVGDEFYLMMEAITGGGVFCYLPGCDVKAYVHTGEHGGLSSGENKIRGEQALHAYKKQFFDQLDPTSRKYIRMRHHAVLAFAYLRKRAYASFFAQGICSFLSSPVGCCKLVLARKV